MSAAVAFSLIVSITVIPVAASRLFSQEEEDEDNPFADPQIPEKHSSPLIFSTGCWIAGMRSQNSDVSRYFGSREELCSEPGEVGKCHEGIFQQADSDVPAVIAADGHRMGAVERSSPQVGHRMVGSIVGMNRWFQGGVLRRIALISGITAGAIFLCWAFLAEGRIFAQRQPEPGVWRAAAANGVQPRPVDGTGRSV
ncbi:hypothetical protein [Blastopirellula retiformator]|uniref:hypothetical protein n=1 Tax=Blastopirellula retiformator TaxID=2527970 RepID=UPI001FE9401F|nr:hypothetical protein [Blastopirellula retiformator]